MTRKLAAVALALVLLAGIWWGVRPSAGPPAVPAQHLATIEEKNATIQLAFERDGGGQPLLAATFQPKQPDLHLYSKDTPRTGVEGLGRPTLLELAPGAPITPRGALSADVAAYPEPDGITDEPLLIYPSGPVTLRLPIEEPQSGMSLPVALTFMLCSDHGYCTPPVENKQLTLRIP
jgi:hypothetical protein